MANETLAFSEQVVHNGLGLFEGSEHNGECIRF